MKRTLIIILIIAAIFGGGAFWYVKSDTHIEFIDNYIQNFSDNLFNLRLNYEIRKAERQAEKELEKQQGEDGNEVVQKEEIEILGGLEKENNDKTPDEQEKENIAQPGKHNISEKEAVKISKTKKKTDDGKEIEVLTKELVQTVTSIAKNDASASKYARSSGGVICASENSIIFYDKTGNERWKKTTNISSPNLKVNNSYILLWEDKGKQACVYGYNKPLYEINTDEKILNAYVSEKGECVLVVEKAYYKGEVKVFNKSGEEIFNRSFGSENVMSAAISNSRKLAISLMSVDKRAHSRIVFFDISKKDEENSITYKDTIVYNLEFVNMSLIAYADNKMICLKQNAKEDWVYDYSDKNLKKCFSDIKNSRLLMFDNLNNAEFSVVSLSGKENRKLTTDVIPDSADIYGGELIFNDERNLYLANTNGVLQANYFASRDIKDAYFIDADNILVVYNTSLEFLHIENVK